VLTVPTGFLWLISDASSSSQIGERPTKLWYSLVPCLVLLFYNGYLFSIDGISSLILDSSSSSQIGERLPSLWSNF
jgi:hypothetical protein